MNQPEQQNEQGVTEGLRESTTEAAKMAQGPNTIDAGQVEGNRVLSGEEAQRARLRERIDHDFRYHPPTGDQPERYVAIRDEARHFAHRLVTLVPSCRELSRALSDLEDVVMHANSGIARHG